MNRSVCAINGGTLVLMCDSVYILFIFSTVIRYSYVNLPTWFEIWWISAFTDTILQTVFENSTWFYPIERYGLQRVLCVFRHRTQDATIIVHFAASNEIMLSNSLQNNVPLPLSCG